MIRERAGSDWYNRIDDTVILGALPFRTQTKQLVDKEHVRAVLSYNQSYELKLFTNSTEEWDNNGVQQHIYHTWDFHPPDMEDITSGLSVIEKHRALKSSVYVHCKAGKGRSATVVTCYLIKRYKLVPNDAIDFLERKRPQISMNKHQRKVIVEFYEQLQKGK
jgi:protein-tyrosine phosphatase